MLSNLGSRHLAVPSGNVERLEIVHQCAVNYVFLVEKATVGDKHADVPVELRDQSARHALVTVALRTFPFLGGRQ